MFYKVLSVMPIDDFKLLIKFSDNSDKQYDVKPLFEKWSAFKSLRDVAGLFGQVKVDMGGYGISWNDDIDLSSDELYVNGKEV